MRTPLWTDAAPCTCNHRWEQHIEPGRMCCGLDSYGLVCSCPSFVLDPAYEAIDWRESVLELLEAELMLGGERPPPPDLLEDLLGRRPGPRRPR